MNRKTRKRLGKRVPPVENEFSNTFETRLNKTNYPGALWNKKRQGTRSVLINKLELELSEWRAANFVN